MEIVRLDGVSKVYGEGETKVRALKKVSMSIEQGERLAIVGPSGSGKSTLLHMIGGVDTPTVGRVIVDGEDITQYKDEQLAVFRRRKIGFIFQSYHLIPVLNIEENITMPILLDYQKPDKEYVDYIIELLGLKNRRYHLPGQLSGGQQQRVAKARALANHPSLILADEPTGSLDSTNGDEVMALLNESVEKLKQTLVVITHNVDLAREADRIVKIADGRICQ
ncbi:MAG: ABC transporter ATP-binding protein [Lachnospiraceae bacterium]|nr:ABC transporter ATP-binding protein [Lachnospiraceae bacterium]